AFDGDRSFVTSAELRVPITSVLSGARLGVTAFMDAAKAFDKGVKLSDADWHQGVGGGVFLIATVVTINVDIAHGLKNGDTRVHLSSGFSFKLGQGGGGGGGGGGGFSYFPVKN